MHEPAPAAITFPLQNPIILNPQGRAPLLLLCDHARNAIPTALNDLGLNEAQRSDHIAWDPGAFDIAQHIAQALDAPLIAASVSRLVIDCNRDPAADDSIVAVSDGTIISGNQILTDADRAERVTKVYMPFHAAIAARVAQLRADHRQVALLAIHSFTPVYQGEQRPWQIGLLGDPTRPFYQAMASELEVLPGLCLGHNLPYSYFGQVYHTLERHGGTDPTLLLELRNDLIRTPADVAYWGDLIVGALTARLPQLLGIPA